MDSVCYRITADSISEVEDLSSNQEEADTKLLLHAKHALNENPEQNIIVRSPSGDVDINILFIAIFQENTDNIWLDYGTGEQRKVLPLSKIVMDNEKKYALIGFHALTGNDYVSSFFRRGKEMCWTLLEKHKKFVTMFSELGNSWSLGR